MPEILYLEYHAGTEGLVVRLDPIGTHGGPVAGSVIPTERVTLGEMDPELAVRWRGLLADTHDALRARVPPFSAIPEELVAEKATLAREREQMARERLAHEAAAKKATEDLAAFAADIEAHKAKAEAHRAATQKAVDEFAATVDLVAAKQAELGALSAQAEAAKLAIQEAEAPKTAK